MIKAASPLMFILKNPNVNMQATESQIAHVEIVLLNSLFIIFFGFADSAETITILKIKSTAENSAWHDRFTRRWCGATRRTSEIVRTFCHEIFMLNGRIGN
ncbi:MAG TPA: hypothetical protein VMR33_07480 [Candidatus Baltobacteraceae bacterium]|jgi:hypothetical protein|nr:hypothetical protein [Candidatus Baltobacteraceae bacterium]